MKSILTLILSLLMLLSAATPLAAQSYEGASLAEGIYYLPEDLGPGSVVRFAAEGLVPNSDVEIRLVDGNRNELDGLTEVQGVVVVRADAAGNINTDLRLPGNVAAGTYILVVTGEKADLTPFSSELAIQLAAAAQDNGDTQPATLALTGSETNNRVFGGVLLVALGLGLVLVASRRRIELPVEQN